jgi:hypothetical protein
MKICPLCKKTEVEEYYCTTCWKDLRQQRFFYCQEGVPDHFCSKRCYKKHFLAQVEMIMQKTAFIDSAPEKKVEK